MASRFLFNADLWDELADGLRTTKGARAAVAYLGTGASRLLPLREGHRLLTDLSLPSVRAGTTDPREVKKFMARGVQVFSRDSLHAKFFVFDRVVIAGSSNISKNAQNVLDEAALLADDPAAVARAASTFDRLCVEPVRPEYLRKCIKEYRPPRFGGARGSRRKGARPLQAKFWIVGGLVYRGVPAAEEAKAEKVAKRAARKLADHDRFEVEHINYPKPQRFFRDLREGDWIVQCIRDGAGFEVYPPARFLGIDAYPRASGKSRYLLLMEQPLSPRLVRWTDLRRSAAGKLSAIDRARPRTIGVTSNEEADALLRLWDAKGRFRKARR
jgi:phospholipase D-like protein